MIYDVTHKDIKTVTALLPLSTLVDPFNCMCLRSCFVIFCFDLYQTNSKRPMEVA